MASDRLIAIGEALIDFIPDRHGCLFREVGAFSPAIGGAPANVCAAFARLGGRASLISQLGDDPFGHKIMYELQQYGVDTSAIRLTKEANTALAFVSLAADGNRTFSFYRKPSADMLLSPQQVDSDIFRDAYALHFCSVSLGDFPMKQTHRKAIDEVKNQGGIISFDPNLRFQLWDSREALRSTVLEFIPYCHILKISDEELGFITGESDIEAALPKLFTGNVKLVVYTCGGGGAYAFTRQEKCFASARKVDVIDTTGAGDGFIGSMLFKLRCMGVTRDTLETMSTAELKKCLDFSNEFCTRSVTKHGAIASYPDMADYKD